VTLFDPLDPLQLDALLSEDELAMRDAVRRFVRKQVLPGVGDWFEHGDFPEAVRTGAAERGLLGMHLDGYGCLGANATSYGLACLELEAGDSGLRSFVSVQGSLSMFPIHRYGSDEQKDEWLPRMAAGDAIGCFGLTEADSGSDPARMRTNARRDGTDWIIDGTKMWITNGGIADVAIVWARTDEGVRGFVIPTDAPGFSTNDVHRKLSLRASVTSELVMEDVRLPAGAVLPGVTGMKGPLSCLTEARYGIVWGAMGAARACLASALEYSSARVQWGRPIAGFQLTQAKLADMAVQLQEGLLLAHHLGRMKDEGRLRPEQVSVGKLNNVRAALEIARTSRSILGASGITLEYPVMRHMNNLESVFTYEGTNEIHTLIVGHALTGLRAFE
jgi:glutaryl-CoA dehydrogenase